MNEKIALIEDRTKRQLHFLEQNNINLDKYANILKNFTEEKASNILEEIRSDSFDLQEFEIIICHKSVENNTVILANLKNYCKKHQKTLVLFSGGISVNYYDNSELELLELNSKTFYSQNLVLFLEAVKTGNEDILMLCYGEYWQQDIVANVLEKTNYLMGQVEEDIVFYDEFVNFTDIEKLSKINHDFHSVQIENNRTTIVEIENFRDSLLSYFKKYEPSKENENITKNIVIHYDNVVDVEFDNDIKFTTDEDIDKYISTYIIKELASKDFDNIFIKDNLSSNYLELYGLRVAYHVRLSDELGNKRFVPIVIISDFDEATLNKFSQEANILFTDEIYLCKNTKEDIEKYKTLQLKSVSNYDEFLSSIEVSPPKDTSGSHDIANQWSIYRWAEILDAKSDTLTKNRIKIENILYFKYLKAKHTNKETKNTPVKLSKKGKVLLIDDEWNKGWADVLKNVLTTNGVEFSVFEYDFKDKTNFNLIVQLNYKDLKNQILASDVVVLDLRLIESDHDNDDIDNYTGIKILQKIHEINAGIQVIMLTATSKSTILEKLYEKKILGYIKKEHPDDTSIDTIDNINKLIGLVDKGLERKYLKEVFIIQNELLNLSLFSNLKLSFDMNHSTRKLFELKNTLSRIFETLDSNIPKPFIYGMLTLYKCIETINDYFIYEKYDTASEKKVAYWLHNNKIIDRNGNASVNNKIKSILNHLNIQNKEFNPLIDQISCTRNFEMHSENIAKSCEEKIVKNISETHMLDWFKIIEKILNKMA
jgi:CheY-like chemotaxis protein